VYHQLDRTEESAAVLQQALEIAPDAVTYSNLGTYLYFQGKYPEAVKAFDEALKLNANSYLRWGNLADAVRMATPGTEKMHESYQRAIQLAQEELIRRPGDLNVRSSVATYFVRDGQTAKALAELEQVVSQETLTAAVLFKACLVAELANQRANALSLLRRAVDAGYRFREIRAEPDLVKLRADPEYHRLASRYER
jgi:tetratricopeptide (TPR) repeat protein